MNENNTSSVQKWLDNLQRESWQLELLVSGFTIFLLIQVVAVLPDMFPSFNMHSDFSPYVQTIIMTFMGGAVFSSNTLLVVLILHILLRGFWIATIGLRSVQKETDFEQLNYSNFFTNKLKTHVQSLDRLIISVDNICSVLFAFAFLIVFMFFSLALWVLFVNGISVLLNIGIQNLGDSLFASILNVFRTVFFTVTIITSLIYLIDTFSLGFFKKYELISKVYYPIYRFLGWITFSFIYRSIYYSLVSRFPKNNIRILLIVFLFLIVMYPFNRITFYKYFPDHVSKSKSIVSNRYDNLRKDHEKIWSLTIPNEVIREKYFPLFIRYNVKTNEVLDSLCTDYQPTKQNIWVSGLQKTGLNDPYYPEDDPDKLLDCLSNLYTVYINDSLYTELDYHFYTYGHGKEKGVRTMINTSELPEGKNTILVNRKKLDKDKNFEVVEIAKLPFWLEK